MEERLLHLLVGAGVRGSVADFREQVKRPLVVTRHQGLVDYLRETGLIGPDAEVVAHVHDPAMLDGRVVIGVLPLHLAARTLAVVEVPLAQTPADRAADHLPVERVRQIAGAPTVYTVRRLGTV
jgi:hypothetical protein